MAPQLSKAEQEARAKARKEFLDRWPREPWPAPLIDGADAQGAFKTFIDNVCGKILHTPIGFSVRVNSGHFFRLTCETTRNNVRKGHVTKAGNAKEAREMLERGEIDASEIAGYKPGRASQILVFADLISDPQVVIREVGMNRVAYHFIKRYENQ